MRIVLSFLLACCLAFAPNIASAQLAGGMSIAVVDLQEALNASEEGKRAIATIEGFAKAKEMEIAKKEDHCEGV